MEKKEGEIDEAVWDLLLSADKKDYERICIEYGITNFRGMLKKLAEMKKEKEEEQAQVKSCRGKWIGFSKNILYILETRYIYLLRIFGV